MPPRVAYLLLFGSGAAGLVYELAWARELSVVFGNTVQSAALVTAVMMCGLGVGGFAAGMWADRRFARAGPAAVARAYGLAEVAIGALGAALAVGLARLDGIASMLGGQVTDAHGWHEASLGSYVARFAIAVVVLAPSTLLLGSTLTLLVRAVQRDSSVTPGVTIGALYGANTAGAALGALATDLVFVPRIGILRTQLVAVAIDVAVGVAALAVARGSESAPSATAPEPATPSRARLGAAAVALFLSGFAALGLEIVWFRVLAGAFGSFRGALSILLATMLGGLFVGSLLGARASRGPSSRAPALLVGSQVVVAVASLLLLVVLDRDEFAGAARIAAAAKATMAVVLLPSIFMGASFPLANAAAEHALAQVGGRSGLLYLANTAGSVAGALVAGFAMLPWIGSQGSAFAFAVAAALGPLPLLALRRRDVDPAAWRALSAVAILAVPVFVGCAMLPPWFVLGRWFKRLPDDAVVLAKHEGVADVIVVAQAPAGRVLYTNGHTMSGTGLLSQRYMRAFAHVPLLLEDAPERALVICFGVGNTLHAVSLHQRVKTIEIADLSRDVLDEAHWFEGANHDVLADPRVSVFVEDGRRHLRLSPPASYDLVTLEPPPIRFAGVAALYSRDFYALARSRLKPGGMMTQWLPAYQVPEHTTLAMIRAFLEVFPTSTVLLSGERPELILLGANGDAPIVDLDRVVRNLEAEPAVAADLRRVRLGSLTEIVGTFLADAETLARATAGVAPVTDDMPSLEYAVTHDGSAMQLPRAVFAVDRVASWCPRCAGDPRVADLPGYLHVLGLFYGTSAFLSSHYGEAQIADPTGELRPVVERSDYLRAIIGSSP